MGASRVRTLFIAPGLAAGTTGPDDFIPVGGGGGAGEGGGGAGGAGGAGAGGGGGAGDGGGGGAGDGGGGVDSEF